MFRLIGAPPDSQLLGVQQFGAVHDVSAGRDVRDLRYQSWVTDLCWDSGSRRAILKRVLSRYPTRMEATDVTLIP
jgi:hypothetical protein